MPDEDILAQFKDFLDQKNASEKEAAESEDFDVEIWDEKGRGVRTKRSHARPFLQSLGIDIDAEPEPDETDDKSTDKTKSKTTGKQAQNATSSSVARKYFTGPKK